MNAAVVSIGYERRTPDEFVAELAALGVRLVVDVRELPLSRRKGFSKTSLSERLGAAGIGYSHLREAGNPYRKEPVDRPECLELYRKHLCENPEILDSAAEQIRDGVVAFLCYEREHEDCHRSVLLEQLQTRGHDMRITRVE